MKAIGYILILALGAVVGFFCACYWNYSSTSNALDTLLAANKEYLYDRFVKAYEYAPTTIAIWEGTNLVSVLDSNSTGRLPPEQRAEMLAIHSRLSELFSESGATKDATAEAEKAKRWFITLVTNQSSISSGSIVTNFLRRDAVKRSAHSPNLAK